MLSSGLARGSRLVNSVLWTRGGPHYFDLSFRRHREVYIVVVLLNCATALVIPCHHWRGSTLEHPRYLLTGPWIWKSSVAGVQETICHLYDLIISRFFLPVMVDDRTGCTFRPRAG